MLLVRGPMVEVASESLSTVHSCTAGATMDVSGR